MEFAELEIAKWGHSVLPMSPNSILDRLVEEAHSASPDYRILSIDLDPAHDPDHLEFRRVSAEIQISEDLFQAFFNGPTGYRAQYALSEVQGERFNRSAVERLASVLAPQEHLYRGDFDRTFCERSLDGRYTKLWFSTSISDKAAEPYLMTLPEVIRHEPWTAWWANKPLPHKGLLAPKSEPPAVLLNGTFLSLSDWSDWDQKPCRSHELHTQGWT